MVRISYESRAIHGPKQSRKKASHGQKNWARVVSRSGERTVRIRKVVGSIPIRSTKMEIAAVKNCGDFSFDHRNTTDGFLF